MTRTERVLQLLFAAAFLAAGILKIVDPATFAVSIARLRVIPMTLVGPVAILLPWIELVAAVALFVPAYRLPALRLLLGLLALFTVVLGVGLLRGAAGACGCFGSSDLAVNRPGFGVVRNVLLTGIAALLLRRKPTSPAGPASPA